LLQEGVLRQFHRLVPCLILLLLVALNASAGRDRVAADLVSSARQALSVVEQLRSAATAPRAERLRERLKAAGESLSACRLLLAERQVRYSRVLERGNRLARERQADFAKQLTRKLDRLQRLMAAALDDSSSAAELDELAALLTGFATRPARPLHGSTPYRQLDLQRVEPQLVSAVTPAYRTDSTASLAADLAGAPEAPVDGAIAAQAAAIAEAAGRRNWDPVDLYEWVKNNIATEWYRGSMKGALETLRQRSGNDADQAALLIALLRAAGFPSRYVVGTVEFFPDIEAAKRLTGLDDPALIGELLRKAGIPHQPVLEGGVIVNYRLEHIWVEALIPYANYRGALADLAGKTWLPLDTSFKVAAFDERGGLDLYAQEGQPLDAIRDDYFADAGNSTPLDYLRRRVDDSLAATTPQVQYNSLLHRRTLKAETLRILPSRAQFDEVAVTAEYSALPDELVHRVRVQIPGADGAEPLLDLTLPLRDLVGRKVWLDFEPESVADQETVALWGGLDNTPSYLVRLRPVLVVDGERKAAATSGFAVGSRFDLAVTLHSAALSLTETDRVVTGYPLLLGLAAQQVAQVAAQADDDAVDYLYRTAMDYIDSWNSAEQELAELFNLAVARPVASLVTVGGVLDVAELLGEPQGIDWRGVFVDADLRAIEAVPRASADAARLAAFMRLSALQGSALESVVLERQFAVASISTAKLFALARAQGVPLLTLDAASIDSVLPTLALDAPLRDDIVDAVANGARVVIPQQPISLMAWSGTGYLKEDPLSGEAGYMLSGSIAGGSTVLGVPFWGAEVGDAMVRPYSGKPNGDPAAAAELIAITPYEVREATAGEELDGSLMVLVRDQEGVPVEGAPVSFSVVKGEGSLLDAALQPVAEVSVLTVTSGADGIARARFIPGQRTLNNPLVIARPGDSEANIVGENLVTAQLDSGSLASLATPIAILGFAGLPELSQCATIGDNRDGDVASYAGTVGLLLADRFGNPVANYAVNFSLLEPYRDFSSPCFDQTSIVAGDAAELIALDDPCLAQLPVRGECPTAAAELSVVSRSDGGVSAGMVLGSSADTLYAVELSFEGSNGPASRVLIQHSAAPGACGVDADPVEKVVLNSPRLRDSYGHNIDARAAGSTTRLKLKSYLLAEGGVAVPGGQHLACAPAPDLDCGRIKGDGSFTLSAPLEVTADGVPLQRTTFASGSSYQPYLYGFDLPIALGLNRVALGATAQHVRKEFVNSCSVGCGVRPEDVERTVGPVNLTTEVWGVAVDTPKLLAVPVDSNGILQRDTDFFFTIQPAEYVAGMAQVLVFADGALWEALYAPKSGTGSVTFPAGYTFLPNKSYEVQLLLNNSGDDNAIYSDRVAIVPVISEVDLHIDGLPEVVEDQVGAFVLLNNDFDERDRQSLTTLLDVETAEIITDDDELKRAWLIINDPDMVGGTWQVTTSRPDIMRIYAELDGAFVELKTADSVRTITQSPLVIPLLLEGVGESSAPHDGSISLSYVSNSGVSVNDVVPLTVLLLDMAVDGDRDRKIAFDSLTDESAMFWVNDDRDESNLSGEEDDMETGNDSLDKAISCRRDLEDFARLQVITGESTGTGALLYSLKSLAQTEKYGPVVNLFHATGESDFYIGYPDNRSDLLIEQQLNERTLATVGPEAIALSLQRNVQSRISPFLYEGRAQGSGQLQLTASYAGVPVLQRQVTLQLRDIRNYYDHFVLSANGDPVSAVNDRVNAVGNFDGASRLGSYQPATDEYVMFVHGWNVEPYTKTRWAETIFKRLWWQGYQGKVGLFDWPCGTIPSWDIWVNYDKSDYTAWKSGNALRTLLEGLNTEHRGSIRLLAHSQGNVVAGEALRSIEPGVVFSYTASQAAISASFYEADLTSLNPPLSFSSFETPEVIGAYPVGSARVPFLSGVKNKVTRMFSYFNRVDYALTGDSLLSPRWEVNNKTKPDGSLDYGYEGEIDTYPPAEGSLGFYQRREDPSGGDPAAYIKHQLVFPEDAHEIFSFGAESHSRALGAVLAPQVFEPVTLSLTEYGSRDLTEDDYDAEHYSHSREFRSNIINEQFYWSNFFVDAGLSGFINTIWR
jgi:transglutaminase-like putative cysteine protease